MKQTMNSKRKTMKQNILVVEDNLILGNILEKWLVRAGYGVIVTTDEPSARQKLASVILY